MRLDPTIIDPDLMPEDGAGSDYQGTWMAVVPDDCLDDVVFPPGGARTRPLPHESADAVARYVSPPSYLTLSGRDLRLDLFRGYFVLAMIIDHVRGASPLYLATGGNRFYTSAVEGFLLVSGMVAGLTYRHLIERDGLRSAMTRVLKRAFSLYLLAVALTLVFLSLSELLRLPWAQGIDLTHPVQLVLGVAALHRTYYLVDILLLYSLLFLASPLAFYFLAHGKTWPVLLGSWALWAMYQIYPQHFDLPWPIAGNYLFAFSAWQVLFVTGLVLGYRRDRLPLLRSKLTHVLLAVTGLASAALIAVYFLVDPPTSLMPGTLATGSPVYHEIRLWLQDNVFARTELRVGRILTSFVVFVFLFLAVSVFWRPVRRYIGWLFIPFGQRALYAYSANAFIVGSVAILMIAAGAPAPTPQWLNAAIQIGSVALIWLLLRRGALAPSLRVRRLTYAVPGLIVVAVLVGLNLFPLAGAGSPLATAQAAGSAAQPKDKDTSTRLERYAARVKGSLQERWFHSAVLDSDMPYILYLPPDYYTADRRYPVLYMLHGRGGSRDEWMAYNFIGVADKAIADGVIPPMIIVLPQGDQAYWANHADNGPRWGDYIDQDVVAHMDSTYRTLALRENRAIGGLSMGGWGALNHAFTHPELYGVVGAHSVALRLPGDDTMTFLGTSQEFLRKDPVELAIITPLDQLQDLVIWIDTGTQDPWLKRATQLHSILNGRGVPHIWQVYPGAHDLTYWREHVIDYVRYYGNALNRQ